MTTPIKKAYDIMKCNIIGPKEINLLLKAIGKPLIIKKEVPNVNYDERSLINCSENYILVYGANVLDILDIRNTFGVDPNVSEPCFYNQDWYLHEAFIRRKLDNKWYLIQKKIIENTRSLMPEDIINKGIVLPSAILCTLTFFAYHLAYGEMLWYHDYVWCDDVDHNGDRIYVGKYHDVDGANKNGFSIHRHLSLRSCYAAVNCIQ